MPTAPLPPSSVRVSAHQASDSQLDDLLQVVNPKGWIALVCLALITGLIILWAIVGHIPVTVTGAGILTRPHKVVGIQSLGSGKLRALHLAPGTQVREGDVLAELDQPELTRQLDEQKARLALLEDQAARTLDLQAHHDLEERTALAEQERNLQHLIAQVTELAPTLKARYEDRKRLYSLKALPIDAVIDAEQSYRANQNRIPELQAQLRQLGLRRDQMTQQFSDLSANRTLQQKDLKATIAVLEAQIRNQGAVRSRFSGRVLEVTATEGQVVSSGTRLATIAVDDPTQPLVALLYFPVKDGKKILAGQDAQTTPDTFKRDRFGGITGKVLSVSSYPVTKQAMANTLGSDDLATVLANGGPQIEVTAALDPDPQSPNGYHWSASQGPPVPQTPGTTVTSRITVETLTPAQLAISLMRQASALY
ncbi:MAG TPA: NHLP bacteriocin system secretion protein [Stenomitos sp.]